MTVPSLPRGLADIFTETGSTRPLALIRIGLVALLWSRYGNDSALYVTHDPALFVLGALFFLFSSLVLVGFRTRAASIGLFAVLFLKYYLFGLVLGHTEWVHHHRYILMACAFCVMLGPAGASYSVDRWLAVRQAHAQGRPAPPEDGPLFATRLMTIQMAALYFWAAVDKTSAVYFRGDWLSRVMEWTYAGHFLHPLLTWGPFTVAASLAVLGVEYFLAWSVLSRRYLRATLVLGIGLHLGFALLLQVHTYSMTMILMYLAVLPVAAVHRTLDTLQGHATPEGAAA